MGEKVEPVGLMTGSGVVGVKVNWGTGPLSLVYRSPNCYSKLRSKTRRFCKMWDTWLLYLVYYFLSYWRLEPRASGMRGKGSATELRKRAQ